MNFSQIMSRLWNKFQLVRLVQFFALTMMLVMLYDLWFGNANQTAPIDAKQPITPDYDKLNTIQQAPPKVQTKTATEDDGIEVIEIGEEEEGEKEEEDKDAEKEEEDKDAAKEEEDKDAEKEQEDTTKSRASTSKVTVSLQPNSQTEKRNQNQQRKDDQVLRNPAGKKLSNVIQKYVPPQRIVHFDLKGAPPRLTYFLDLLALIKDAGGTGVLIEWEDMFPYEGVLAQARNGNAYSKEDVKMILQTAQEFGLSVIPLVQIFGHMEWVLKLAPFAHLRDHDKHSTVICAAKEEAWQLIQLLIDQVIQAHQPFGIPFFHIGADEVFNLGNCPEVSQKLKEDFRKSKGKLMIWHIERVAEYVKSKSADTRVLAWHDMLDKAVQKYNGTEDIFHLVEPVVWNYGERLSFQAQMWKSLKPFTYLWGGSSFKGADGPSRFYANPSHYLSNQVAWLQVLREQSEQFEVRGLILTGWSRFDHFAILCEIWPVAVPSLLFSLVTLNFGNKMPEKDMVKAASLLAECPLDLRTGINPGKTDCSNFTETNVLVWIKQLRNIQQTLEGRFLVDNGEGYEYRGWLARTNRRMGFSSSWYLQKMNNQIIGQLQSVKGIYTGLKQQLKLMFYDDMVTEFLFQYVQPTLVLLEDAALAIENILKTNTFPLRPFSAMNETLLAEADRIVAKR